jgi:hypothetical protein
VDAGGIDAAGNRRRASPFEQRFLARPATERGEVAIAGRPAVERRPLPRVERCGHVTAARPAERRDVDARASLPATPTST